MAQQVRYGEEKQSRLRLFPKQRIAYNKWDYNGSLSLQLIEIHAYPNRGRGGGGTEGREGGEKRGERRRGRYQTYLSFESLARSLLTALG